MQRCVPCHGSMVAFVLVALAGVGVGASATEVQLAGIRLGNPAQTVRDVYGEPEVVLVQPEEPREAGAEAARPPAWATAVWTEAEPGEVQWFYRKGDAAVGVVLDRDSLVRAIAVAGGPDAAWRPHRYAKLGDNYKRVLYRYGYPDKVQWLAGNGVDDRPGPEIVGPNAVHDDCVLTYSERNNIAFVIHEGGVARINIWKLGDQPAQPK
ncbi:MAG: hypothetical protein FJX75_06755 [Armatimonadetes bacterium]|nr:hypothetical protein [Armatimonadota bacterium]